MPFHHRLQSSRFELKYLIDETLAHNIRDFVGSYLELDEHADPAAPHCAYRIASLYLDTPALALYGQTLGGMKNRFKLRIRFYDDRPDGPAFMEIKARETDVIRKERACVTREGVRRFLAGDTPGHAHLMGNNNDGSNKSAAALQRFWRLCRHIGAEGVAYVCYMREAYVSPNSDQIRVTFDRELMGAPFDPRVELSMPRTGVFPELNGVVLEMKFTDRFPDWMRDLVETFNIQRRSVAKYCYCVEALGFRPGQWRYVAQGIGR
ncbi:MAG: polyphosphate polymerase domain-containing protein [Pirellulales bacterium]|nr:polyphosphate polymerase domain-containing protein [Pirellulales bacterium]